MTEDLLDAHKDCKKLMPLLHLPVQSGSSKILKNHGYSFYRINESNKIPPNTTSM